ncbi:hypothetical protein BLOT_002845 [Blomia tropicalis]|nr:hypothetical protein BLOT_002845 [Blomia tropicalis]
MDQTTSTISWQYISTAVAELEIVSVTVGSSINEPRRVPTTYKIFDVRFVLRFVRATTDGGCGEVDSSNEVHVPSSVSIGTYHHLRHFRVKKYTTKPRRHPLSILLEYDD